MVPAWAWSFKEFIRPVSGPVHWGEFLIWLKRLVWFGLVPLVRPGPDKGACPLETGWQFKPASSCLSGAHQGSWNYKSARGTLSHTCYFLLTLTITLWWAFMLPRSRWGLKQSEPLVYGHATHQWPTWHLKSGLSMKLYFLSPWPHSQNKEIKE